MNHGLMVEKLSIQENMGQKIRFIRVRLLGLSRAQFCSGSDFSEPTLKAWETATIGGITEKAMPKLLKQLKKLNIVCTENWLLHGIGLAPTMDLASIPLYKGQSDREAIANRIKYVRSRVLGMTRQQFCNKSDFTEYTIKMWESGLPGFGEKSAQNMSKHLSRLGLNCTAEWLLSGIGEIPIVIIS